MEGVIEAKLAIYSWSVLVDTHIEHVDVEDHEVKGEGESHGHQKVDVNLRKYKY